MCYEFFNDTHTSVIAPITLSTIAYLGKKLLNVKYVLINQHYCKYFEVTCLFNQINKYNYLGLT